MNVRKIGLAAAAIAALSPAVSQASEKAALDACARAFASSLASPGAAAPAYTLVYSGSPNVPSIVDYFARDYSFDLHADNQRTGLPIARARCSTDMRGNVVALSPIPLQPARATLAAR